MGRQHHLLGDTVGLLEINNVLGVECPGPNRDIRLETTTSCQDKNQSDTDGYFLHCPSPFVAPLTTRRDFFLAPTLRPLMLDLIFLNPTGDGCQM